MASMQPAGGLPNSPFAPPLGMQPAPRSKGMSPVLLVLLIVGGIVGFGTICLVGVVAWALTRGGSPEPMAQRPAPTVRHTAPPPRRPPQASPAGQRSGDRSDQAWQRPTPAASSPAAAPPSSSAANASPAASSRPNGSDYGSTAGGSNLPVRTAADSQVKAGKPLESPLQPDPPPESLRFTLAADKPLSIPLGRARAHYPTTVSPFVALSTPTTQEVWDLRTATRTGQVEISNIVHTNSSVLSPDGRYLAYVEREKVYVRTFQGGKEQTFTRPAIVKRIDFAGPDELLIVEAAATLRDGSPVTIINLESGQTVRQFKTSDGYNFDLAQVAISPGRRYLAVGGGSGSTVINLYDLTKGAPCSKVVASLNGTMQGLAFSPEGDELSVAGLSNGFNAKLQILAWNLQSGRQTANHELAVNDLPAIYQAAALEPLPDHRGWLVKGKILVDYQTGKRYFDLTDPSSGLGHPRRVIGPDQILVADAAQGAEGLLTKLAISQDQVAAANVTVPTAARADVASAKVIEIPGGKIAWEYSADPAPAAKTTLLAEPLLLGSKTGQLLVGQASSPEAARLVTLSTPNKQSLRFGRLGLDDAVWIDHYDIAAGKHLGHIDLPRGSKLLDTSPDGTRVLLRRGARLDVIALADGKHVAGWRPNAEADAENNDNDIRAAFIDSDHVLTADKQQLVLWKVPACTAVYRIEDASIARWPGVAAVSPGRKYFVTLMQKTGRPAIGLMFESLTGKLSGVVPLPKAHGTMHTSLSAVAFRPDGQQLALSTTSGTLWLCEVIDLARGTPLAEAPQALNGDVCWAGPGHVLHSQSTLFDVGRRLDVASCFLGAEKVVCDTADGRLWCLVGATFEREKLWLASLTLLDKAALAQIETEVGKTHPIVGPGKAVSLSVEIDGPDDAAGKVRAHLTQKLKDNGIEVSDGAAVRLVAKSEVSKNETRQLTLSGPGRGREVRDVNLTYLKCTLQFESGDKVIWSNGSVFSPNVPLFITAKGEDDLQKQIDNMERPPHDRVKSFLLSAGLPQTIYGPKPEKLVSARATLPEIITRPPSRPLAGGGNTARPPGFPPSVRPPAGFPPAATEVAYASDTEHRDYVGKAYAELLKQQSWDKLRTNPKLGRPLLGLRWALGTETSTETAQRDVDSFSNFSGKAIFDGLAARGQRREFGEFPQDGSDALRRPALVGAGARGKLLAAARRNWADLLLLADIDTKRIGLTGRSNTSITVRIFDVASGDQLWASEPLKQLNYTIGKQFADYVVKQVADAYTLSPVTATPAAAAKRGEALGKKEFVHPLAALVEVDYYRHKELLSQEAAAKLYETILGIVDGRKYADADAEKRKQLIDEWLPGWIADD
jgi:WD40 repeat protein